LRPSARTPSNTQRASVRGVCVSGLVRGLAQRTHVGVLFPARGLLRLGLRGRACSGCCCLSLLFLRRHLILLDRRGRCPGSMLSGNRCCRGRTSLLLVFPAGEKREVRRTYRCLLLAEKTLLAGRTRTRETGPRLVELGRCRCLLEQRQRAGAESSANRPGAAGGSTGGWSSVVGEAERTGGQLRNVSGPRMAFERRPRLPD
jgi:hypothetical protein